MDLVWGLAAEILEAVIRTEAYEAQCCFSPLITSAL
jgi:hypothetical protein